VRGKFLFLTAGGVQYGCAINCNSFEQKNYFQCGKK
jgi:hypothetical protein